MGAEEQSTQACRSIHDKVEEAQQLPEDETSSEKVHKYKKRWGKLSAKTKRRIRAREADAARLSATQPAQADWKQMGDTVL